VKCMHRVGLTLAARAARLARGGVRPGGPCGHGGSGGGGRGRPPAGRARPPAPRGAAGPGHASGRRERRLAAGARAWPPKRGRRFAPAAHAAAAHARRRCAGPWSPECDQSLCRVGVQLLKQASCHWGPQQRLRQAKRSPATAPAPLTPERAGGAPGLHWDTPQPPRGVRARRCAAIAQPPQHRRRPGGRAAAAAVVQGDRAGRGGAAAGLGAAGARERRPWSRLGARRARAAARAAGLSGRLGRQCGARAAAAAVRAGAAAHAAPAQPRRASQAPPRPYPGAPGSALAVVQPGCARPVHPSMLRLLSQARGVLTCQRAARQARAW